jgi:hypothetical protein
MRLLHTLQARGAEIYRWDEVVWADVGPIVESSHNVLCGLSDAPDTLLPWAELFTNDMNESAIPVHTVGAPTGFDLHGIHPHPFKLFASSTLSIGLPLEPLMQEPHLLGRHYLADAGWRLDTYRQTNFKGAPLFAEQPVVKLSNPAITKDGEVD